MNYEVEYSFSALDDLAETYHYISGQLENPMSAQKVAENIIKKCKMLRAFPKGNSVSYIIDNLEFHTTHVGNFTILFLVDDKLRKVIIKNILDPQIN